MTRRSPTSRGEWEAVDGTMESRNKTFLVQRRVESADGASSSASFSSPEIDSVMLMVNSKFDRKERQIKTDFRHEFEQRLLRDRQHNEEIIETLRSDLSNLMTSSHEMDHMREQQKYMQHQINNQQDKIISLKDENTKLKAESLKVQSMTEEVVALRSENEALIKQKASVEVKEQQLTASLAEKDHDILRMKLVTDAHYKKLQLDLSNTRHKFHTERECLNKKLRHQNVMLTEISAAVKNLSGPNRVPIVVGSRFNSHSKEARPCSNVNAPKQKFSPSKCHTKTDLSHPNDREKKQTNKKS